MKKKILITGSNGLIGSSLVREFINKYDLILIEPYSNRNQQFSNSAMIVKKDLSSLKEWKYLLEGIYCVVHLAAAVHWTPKNTKEEEEFIQTNFGATKMLYEACVEYGVERFLFFSTNDVYEATDAEITEESPVSPKDVYGISKLMAENYLLEQSTKNKTAVCIFRPASVYGFNDKGSMNTLIKLCRKGIIPMIGDGTNKKALLYITDVNQVVELYIESEDNLNGEVFNISSGNYHYKDIIDCICDIFEYKPFRLYIPLWFCQDVASKIAPFKKLAAAAETKIVSADKAHNLLRFKGKYSLKDGLTDAKDFYTEN